MRRSLVLGGLGLLLLASPIFVSAQSIADLQSQIQALLAQIAGLKSQQMPPIAPPFPPIGDDYPTPPTGNTCPQLSITMQRGSRDATTRGQVSELQIWLANRYGLNDDDVVTGYFGAMTEKYVKLFQSENNLPAYGIVGSQTRAAIARTCGGATTPPISCENVKVQTMCNSQEQITGYGPCGGVICRPIGETKCGVNSFAVTGAQCGAGSSGYWGASFTCHDGFSGNIDVQDSCSSVESLRANASRTCANRCTSTVNIFTATPTSGNAPLTVSFSGAIQSAGYSIDYGDGTSSGSIGCGHGGCPSGVSAAKQINQTHTYTAPGTYTAKLRMHFANNAANCAGIDCNVVGTATVTVTGPNSQSITVIAPNGGEQWEMGVMGSITWTPYGYNPDINPSPDVTAYLDRYGTGPGGEPTYFPVGRIVPSGKASIHWEGQIVNFMNEAVYPEPGNNYFIRIVNNKTGATDRSDRAFTIVQRPVDLKVNDQDGGVTLPSGTTPFQLTWKLRPDVYACRLEGVNALPLSIAPPSGATVGTLAFVPPLGTYTSVAMKCLGPGGVEKSDYVSIQVYGPSVPPSIQVLSPNGGELLPFNQLNRITWNQAGLRSVSVALYKNDQWIMWLEKDMNTQRGDGKNGIDWIPSGIGLGALNEFGNVFKIYITGQKADGTGYVDDKSDAPFSFISSPNTIEVSGFTRVQTSTLTPSGRVLGTYDDFRDNSGITMQQSIDGICRLAGKSGAYAPLSYSCAPTGTLTESRHNGQWGYFDQPGHGWCSATGVQWVDCSASTTVSSEVGASNSSNTNVAAAVATYEQLIGVLNKLLSLLKQ